MCNKGDVLHGTSTNDPDWIRKLSLYSDIIITDDDLTCNEKKFLVELFLEYKREGFQPKEALLKAKKVIEVFKRTKIE